MINGKKVVALIPDKAESLRVVGKNMRVIQGLPLVARKVKQLMSSSYIDEVCVGSDSEEILAIAKTYGAVPVRRNPVACDEKVSPANVMIKDFVMRVSADIVVWAHCTNPFIYSGHYDDAIDKYFSNINQYDSLLSVTKIQSHMWNKYGFPANYNPYAQSHTLAKELDPVFFQDGGIFIQAYDQILNNSYFFGRRPCLYELDMIESLDINTELDLFYVESLASAMDLKFNFK